MNTTKPVCQVLLSLVLFATGFGTLCAGDLRDPNDLVSSSVVAPHRLSSPRWPGEFERYDALLLGCGELSEFYPDVLADIVQATQQRVTVVALVNDEKDRTRVSEAIDRRMLPADSVRFIQIPHDTMWIRDYGPLAVRTRDGAHVLLDAEYDFGRPKDDDVPAALAHNSRATIVPLPIALEGGNLLSNGLGLCIASTKVVDHNSGRGHDERAVREFLRENLGAEQIVFLEPLVGEPTGHVDMFATFTGPDTVVVGFYSADADPENAEILDRNAERLRQVVTRRGPLRVVRIPMPSHEDGIWRTFTNCIYANGALLMPTYPTRPEPAERRALATYRRLLPDWTIVPIDVSDMIVNGGALHCISMNVCSLEEHKPARTNGLLNLVRRIDWPFEIEKANDAGDPLTQEADLPQFDSESRDD